MNVSSLLTGIMNPEIMVIDLENRIKSAKTLPQLVDLWCEAEVSQSSQKQVENRIRNIVKRYPDTVKQLLEYQSEGCQIGKLIARITN